MRDFKQLKVWEKAHRLTLEIYHITGEFPKHELYGLTSQLRRAVSSVPTNLAEGYGRSGQTERSHFLNIALGSACEVEYLLLLSKDLGYIPETEFNGCVSDLEEVRKMLIALYQKIRSEI